MIACWVVGWENIVEEGSIPPHPIWMMTRNQEYSTPLSLFARHNASCVEACVYSPPILTINQSQAATGLLIESIAVVSTSSSLAHVYGVMIDSLAASELRTNPHVY